MTPNIALGGNTAIEDIVVLTNLLHGMLEQRQDPSQRVSAATLNATFDKYQNSRLARVKYITTLSAHATRAQAQTNSIYRVVAFLMDNLPIGPAATQLGEMVRAGAKLSFVGLQKPAPGKIRWKDDEESEKLQRAGDGELTLAQEKKSASGNPLHLLWRRATKVGIVAAAAVFFAVRSIGR